MSFLSSIQKFLNSLFTPGPIDLVKLNSMDDDVDFERCVVFVLAREGGYVNDKNDSGGETKFGISKRSFPSEDIKNLTIERAKEIYKQKYWNAAECDKREWPSNLIVFDTSVNMGVSAALRLATDHPDDVEYLNARVEFYKTLAKKKPKNLKFLKGWLNRIASLRREAGLI